MKKIILAVAVAAVASMAVVCPRWIGSPASAGVERYQMQTMTITAVQPEDEYRQWDDVWTHTYNVTLNPCDGSFTGIGSQVGDINGPYGTQTITGNLDGTPSASRQRAPTASTGR